MSLPTYFPGWMYLYFAGFGSIALVLVALVFWTWMKVNRLANGYLRTALKWNMVGYIFMFSASWFACGIGAGPGNLLSTDLSMHNPFLATMGPSPGCSPPSPGGPVCWLDSVHYSMGLIQEKDGPTHMNNRQFPGFRSPGAQARYMCAYDTVMEKWPVPYQTLTVYSQLGKTHIIECGLAGSAPLIFLSGFGASSTMWVPMIERLSQAHHLFALDTIGDQGKSILNRKLRAASEYVLWLEEVMRELKFEKISIVGFSQGGWIAMNFAIHAPEHVDQLILISPNAGFVPVSPRFLLRLVRMAVFPTKSNIHNWARWNSTAWDYDKPYFQLLFEQMRAGMKSKISGVLPITFTDEELSSLSMPVLMLVGEQEIVNDAKAAIQRGQALVPEFEAEVIPNARHMLPFDQPQLVCEHILEFLTTKRN
ncbi:MAG TPA: alpha/beta hydrolase [Anaerolineales bacterium]|nr:alpha/beta hydrolase [Anaerolineales bacterium]